MKKKIVCLLIAGLSLVFSVTPAMAQQTKIDSLFMNKDTTAVLDSLMADFDLFLDSLSKPKSMFFVGVGIGTGFFSFENKNSVFVTTEKKMIFSPSVGYFHKSGLGLSAVGFAMNDNSKFSFYQFAISPSYDLLRKKFSTGISYTKYFNKDSLSFYTTPIHDELFAYFTYKNWWLRSTISMSYGWGSNTEFEKEKRLIWSRRLQQYQSLYITVKNEESVRDFSLTASVRKDFDWYDVIAKKDNITITPVLMLNSGTQQFGFNTSYTYNVNAIRTNSLPSNNNASASTDFALQSASAVLRASYLKGKFLFQPQVFFDYYLQPTDSNPLNVVYSVSVNFAF